MKTWRIDLVAARGTAVTKAMEDIITVNLLRTIRNTDPEAWSDLLRLLKKVSDK